MEIRVAIAKVNGFASEELGDQVEVIERPHGGLSVILAEGKLKGQHSTMIARKGVQKVLASIFEGVHDGTAARQVLAEIQNSFGNNAQLSLSLLSCDLQSNSIILTKNNDIPVIIIRNSESDYIRCDANKYEGSPDKPSVYQFPLDSAFTIIMFSDGVAKAGSTDGYRAQWCTFLGAIMEEQNPSVQDLADFLLDQAIGIDYGEPKDDMSVVALQVSSDLSSGIRRMSLILPV